jgi:hypothetical protein
MPGRQTAVRNGADLRDAVAVLAESLGLEVEVEVEVGRRIWGSRRRIDVIARHPRTRTTLGIECKYQATPGTAQEKIAATIEDMKGWPIRGIVVFDGEGFTDDMVAYLLSTGKAIEFRDLQKWIQLYFGL